jgi:hypothetical protein
MMKLVNGFAMMCSEATNDPLKAPMVKDLPSVFRFLTSSVARKKRKNDTNTTNAAKGEVVIKKVQPATEVRSQKNKPSEF